MYPSPIASAITLALAGTAHLTVMAETAPTNSSSSLNNIHNQCIVQMQSNLHSNEVTGLANSMLKRANMTLSNPAKLTHIYKHSIKGFTITMPCSAAQKAFGDDPSVNSFTPDSIVSISKRKPTNPGNGGGGEDTDNSVSQSTPWGVTRVGGSADGTGRTAWVIDTGIDLNNADLNVDANRGFSAFTKGKNAGMNDGHGHGTHVAGTIAAIDNSIDVVGVAAGATVVPVKVLDSRGSGSTSGVIAGIDYVAANATAGDCANMSLGGGVSNSLDNAVKVAASYGIFFVLAAGNSGAHASNHSPARANGANIFTISATDINDNMPSWSNWGNPPVDYAAPGVSISSLKRGGGVTTMSGTSMAAPAACGVIMMTNGQPKSSGNAGNDRDGNPDPIIHL
ncbi:S8 family serine peptidase [Shewanella nanhaiensis]|uniref:S8 family serine peptidase n=1 Tax=Shewanella nanhaiensis TaxID=2864872 RepID=A0ABS7E817_9GAMM|nr:S8 family serine peptidase [Shewanella nanhaiensis]MBW8185805.1 S8 family serine peptidase [Shewanella nanhaiensis]